MTSIKHRLDDSWSSSARALLALGLVVLAVAAALTLDSERGDALHAVQVSAGSEFTCVIMSGGELECWGNNLYGLADAPEGRFSQVSAGDSHTCAVTSGDTVECWGHNSSGRANAPAGRFSQVSAGEDHTCAVASGGAVECWGRNWAGQTDAPEGRFSQVSAGDSHTCAVTSGDTVECWGHNSSGRANAPAGRFSQVSAGEDHTCAVASGGAVECWGRNWAGQTDAPEGRFSQVSAGNSHTCAVTSGGAVECWGRNNYGQTDAPEGRFSQVSAGTWHSCAVTSGGAVECWGQNSYRQSVTPTGRYSQVSISNLHSTDGQGHTCAVTSGGELECWGSNRGGKADAPAGRFNQVSAGQYHTCAITTAGQAECWGLIYNHAPSLPSGTVSQISAGDDSCAITTSGELNCWARGSFGRTDRRAGRFSHVSTGSEDTCAITTAGEMECWGKNLRIRALLGGGSSNEWRSSYIQVSVGWRHACAITTGGAVECHGTDTYGETDAPTGRFSQVSAGVYHTCAITTDGAVKCWGSNRGGKADAPAGRFSQVSAGQEHTCAITTGGHLECWGAFRQSGSSFAEGHAAQGDPTVEDSQPATNMLKLRVQPGEDAGAIVQHAPEYRSAPVIGDGDVSTEQVLHARLEARPEIGWRFSHWSGDLSGTHPEALVRLQGQQQITAHFVETKIETLTARIVVRPLADGRIEFALQATDERRILPDTRLFPRNATVDSWLTSSKISYHGQPLGQIAARRLADGRTEFRFVTPEGKRLLPSGRKLPANPSEGWKRSTEIEIPLPGCRLSEPVEEGYSFPTRKITIDDSGNVYNVTGVPLNWTYQPEQVVGDNVRIPGKWIRTGSDVRYLVCGGAPPTDQERDRALELSIQQIQNEQAFAALPAGVPTSTNLVNVRARYLPSDDKVEMFIVDVNAGDELKVDSRYVFKSTLEDGAWHSLKECVEVSNWQCVTPLVRLATDQYEFGVRSADTQVEPLYPSSRGLTASEFEQGAFLGIGGLGAWKETSSVAVPGLGADQCEKFSTTGVLDFDDWVTVERDIHVKSEGGVYYVCRGAEGGLSAADAAFTAAVRNWLLDLSDLRDSSSKLGVESAYDDYEVAKEEFDTGIWPSIFGELLKWGSVVGTAGSGASAGGVTGALVGAFSQAVADEVQRAILEPVNEAVWGSNTDFHFDTVPAYYQLGARVDLIGWRLEQWEEIETKVEKGATLSFSDAQMVYAAWRDLRAVAVPAAKAVNSDGFIKNRTDLDAIARALGVEGLNNKLKQREAAAKSNPTYYSTFTTDVETQYAAAGRDIRVVFGFSWP